MRIRIEPNSFNISVAASYRLGVSLSSIRNVGLDSLPSTCLRTISVRQGFGALLGSRLWWSIVAQRSRRTRSGRCFTTVRPRREARLAYLLASTDRPSMSQQRAACSSGHGQVRARSRARTPRAGVGDAPYPTERDAVGEIERVRLFHGTLDGGSFDHLTSVRCGREVGSGFGMAPSA